MALNQASDQVIWSIVRKQNSRARPEASFGIRPFFTRESGNLIQRNVFKHSGYRGKTVGVSRRIRQSKRRRQRKSCVLTLVLKKNGKNRKPSQSRVACNLSGIGSSKFVRRQVRAQTSYRLYRNDLANVALKRVMKVKNHQKRYLRRRKRAARRKARNASRPNKQGGSGDASGGNAAADMELVD